MIADYPLQVWRWSQLKLLPEKSGVYFVMAGAQIIYVGESGNVKQRLNSHDKKRAFEEHGATSVMVFEMDLTDRKNSEWCAISRLKPMLNNGGRYHNA